MTYSFTAGYTNTYYVDGVSTGSSLSDEVPALYPVAIAGHPYLLDLKSGKFEHQSIPVLRNVFITADTLGEKQLNPEALFRSSQNTWHKGAGQVHLDRTDSDPARFRTSKGVDVWTRWQISLLPDTSQARASANTNLCLTVAGTYLYAGDGNSLLYTTDLTTFTPVTGTPATAVTGVTSDGDSIYTGYTGNGLYVTTRGAAAATQLVTSAVTPSVVGYVRGRLMLTVANAIYNIISTAPAVLPTVLYTHPNPTFQWVGFAEGVGNIYAAGYSGDKSLIYRIGIQPDGTALSVPVQAGQLPDGEIVRAIQGYLGFILIGTDKGVRLAQPAGNGDLTIGALLPTGVCRCFEGQDRFVWFGWDTYDAASTGLGRLDLQVINDGGEPAYASDLMVTGQNHVLDVVTFSNQRVLAVSGQGIYNQSTSLVPSGTLETGLITYDLPDQKIALYLDVKHVEPLVGTHSAYIAVDEGNFTGIGTHTSGDTEIMFSIPELRGETFEVREQLLRYSDPTLGPVLTRHSLFALEAVDSGEYLLAPILLTEKEEQTARDRDVAVELAFLKGLRKSSKRVTYQEGASVYSVTVEDYDWFPTHLTGDGQAFNGTCLIKMKTI